MNDLERSELLRMLTKRAEVYNEIAKFAIDKRDKCLNIMDYAEVIVWEEVVNKYSKEADNLINRAKTILTQEE